jgi:hypothetical protein
MRVLVLIGLVAATASTATIRGDRFVGPVPMGSGTPAQARAAFGPPVRVVDKGNVCKVGWPRVGLSMEFLDFAGHGCTAGGVVVAIAGGRAWKTDRGLHVGDPIARLRSLYPNASFHRGDGWWLVARTSCAAAGSQKFPGLLASVSGGKVGSFVVTAGVCD